MFHMNKTVAALAAAIIISSTGVSAATPATSNAVVAPRINQTEGMKAVAKEFSRQETFALLWMRSSSEYRSLCYQGYNAAMTQVDKALLDQPRKSKPLAIVLDCDETVVDNTPGLAASATKGDSLYTSPWWRRWIREARAGAMPGAVDFLNTVHNKGVAIFYVTNRNAKYSYDGTVKNLKALNFPCVDKEHLLLMTTTSDKMPRLNSVAEKYDVVVYMGDDSNDLPLGLKGKSMAERSTIIDAHKADFGTKFIVFPNPVYGNWVSAMNAHYLSLTPQEREEVNKSILLH